MGADLDIEVARVEEATSLHSQHDVILLAAIPEHLYDPMVCLRRVRDALVDDGLIFIIIDVPNECGLWQLVGNAWMRLRGRDWAVNLAPTFPPYHVVGFCPKSLSHLLSVSGFSVLEMKLHRWPNALPVKTGLLAGLERAAAGSLMALGK